MLPTDLHRMQSHAQVATKSEETVADERRRLKQLSDERAQRWPNTLQVRGRQHACA